MSRLRTGAPAVGAGLLIAAALPPWGFWPLAFVGIALLDRLLGGTSRVELVRFGRFGRFVRFGRFGRGVLVGFGWFAPSIIWIGAFTIPGYVIAVAFYSAMLGLAFAACPPAAPQRWLALPGLLVLFEAVRGRWPFGGVPVSTLAMGQVGGPLVEVARAGGPLLLAFVAALAGVLLSTLAARRWRASGVAAATLLVAMLAASVGPRAHDIGALRYALVQGGGQQGTRLADVDPAVVFERHLDASRLVRGPVDVVLWPEDVIDVNGPVTSTPQGTRMAELARRLDATLIAGAVEGDAARNDRFHNVVVAWDPSGLAVARYEKVRRVPFGEYVPLRSLLEPFAGSQLVPRDALPGADPATISTPAATFGVVISWEVFFADRARAAVRDGGEVLLNPTNGASFEGSLVQAQQIASSRLRAIETDRWTLQAAPTGYSAAISPDGRVLQRSAISEQRVLQGVAQRRSGLTWAVRFGDWPALVLSAFTIAAALAWSRASAGPRGWPEPGRSPRSPRSPDGSPRSTDGSPRSPGLAQRSPASDSEI